MPSLSLPNIDNPNTDIWSLSAQIQEIQAHKDVMPGSQHVNFELTKEALETMLDGLGKIRDQLSSIAQ